MTISGSVIAGLLSAGILRAASQPFAKIARLHNLAKDIDKVRQNDEIVDKAFSDFEYIFSKMNDGTSEEYDSFFKEIQRSGLIQHIAESSITRQPSKEAKRAFIRLHKIHVKDNTNKAEDIYCLLSDIFYKSVRAMFNDPSLSYYLDTIHENLSEHLFHIEESLKKYNGEAQQYSKSQLKDYTKRIAKSIQSDNKKIHIETTNGRKPVDIKKIFINPSLRSFQNSAKLKKLSKLTIPQHADDAIETRGAYKSEDEYLDELCFSTYGEFKRNFARAVIVGDPGGGKTTLCQNLCFELAGQCAHAMEYKGKGRIDHQLTKLPIRIVLRSFEKAVNQDPQKNLTEYIVSEIQKSVAMDKSEIEECIKYNLSIGGALLAFDGLDEILETSKRREFVELVDKFINKYPLCPVIVTSREVGYYDAPLGDDFEVYYLEQLQNEQVKQYVQKFIKINSPPKSSIQYIESEAKRFIRQTETNAQDLRRNPLMLGLMVWLFFTKGDVPSNRPAIYSACATLMFEEWDPNRGIYANVPDDFDLLHLFANLAEKIYGDPAKEEGVSKEWLKNNVYVFFREQYSDDSKAWSATSKLVKFITGRSWVMFEVGDRVYKFTHRTFLEYFFARHIQAKHDTTKSLVRELRPHIEVAEWDVVCHLSLQLTVYRNQRKVEEAIGLLRNFIGIRKGVRRKLSILRFCAKALEYLPAREAELADFVISICEESFKLAQSQRVVPLLVFSQLCGESVERSEFVRKTISEYLVKKFRSGNQTDRQNVIEVLAERSIFVSYEYGGSERGILSPEIRKTVKQSISSTMFSMGLNDRRYGYLYLLWYKDKVEKIVDAWGVSVLCETAMDDSFFFAPPFVLFVQHGLSSGSDVNRSTFPGAEDILARISKLWYERKESIVEFEPLLYDSFYWVSDNAFVGDLSRSGKRKEVRVGGAFLILCFVEIVERELKSHSKRRQKQIFNSGNDRRKGPKLAFFGDRSIFLDSKTGKKVKQILAQDTGGGEYLREWKLGANSLLHIVDAERK